MRTYFAAVALLGLATAASAAPTTYNLDPERGDTTTRGDGTSKPIITSMATGLKPTVTFKTLSKPTDPALIAMLAATSTGAAVAIRTKSSAICASVQPGPFTFACNRT